LGLKGQECLYKTCFCQAVSQADIATAIFNNWQWKKDHDVLPARLLPYFTAATFYFFLKVKSWQAAC
jgi:hypothetical protein